MKNLLFISVTILFNFNSSAQKKKAKFPGEMNIQSMIEPIPMSAKIINDNSYIWCGRLVFLLLSGAIESARQYDTIQD